MQRSLLAIFALAILVTTLMASPVEHKVRHHGKHHRKNHESPSHKNHPKHTQPPNMWAILGSNKSAGDDASGPKYNDDIQSDHDSNEIAVDSSDFEPQKDDSDESIKKTNASNCPKCKQSSVKMSEDELTNLRIEYVKNQILHKLGMTERPAPVDKDELPEPVQEGYAIAKEDHSTDYLNRHLDDYFAKTTQKIIFLTQETEKCQSHVSKDYPSECFSFQIPSDVDVSIVESAQLWIYKEPDNMDFDQKQTFLLSEIGHWGSNLNFTRVKPIAIREVDMNEEDWGKIDIEWPVKNWVEFHELSHTIQVACETCGSKNLPISIHGDRKPFIVIDTFPQKTISRKSRSINCEAGSNECCRDSLYIDFKTIGWDDWIIAPQGYHAYFCRGACDRVASITQSSSSHYSVINKFMKHDKNNKNKKKLELVPCCTATRYTSLQILYINSNKTATQSTLPNMIVESCGCS